MIRFSLHGALLIAMVIHQAPLGAQQPRWDGRGMIADNFAASYKTRLKVVMPRGRLIVTRGNSEEILFEMRVARIIGVNDTMLVTPSYPGGWKIEHGPWNYPRLVMPDSGPPVELRIEVPVGSRLLQVEVTDSADVYIDNHPGAIEVTINRGKAEIFDILGPAFVEMQSGPITATIARGGPVGALSLLTRKGNVSLKFPDGGSMNLDAETRRGVIVSNLSLPGLERSGYLTPARTPSRSIGRVGSGGPLTRIVTLEGGIVVLQSTGPGPAPRN